MVLILLNAQTTAQDYDHYSLSKLQTVLNNALVECGQDDVSFLVTEENGIVDFNLEVAKMYLKGEPLKEEFFRSVSVAAAIVGEVTSHMTTRRWLHGKMWVISMRMRYGWVFTSDCRHAVKLGPEKGSRYIFKVLRLVKK